MKRIKLANKKYSLNKIENEILRPQFKDPRIHFAVNCAAKSCPPLYNHAYTAENLETTLGPDTGELGLRVGLHSGPVTAGVLRGERARFQLFGDTMNTAARMEQTGLKNKIQISQATADILMAGGKR